MIDDPITFPPNMRYSTFQQVVAAKNYPFTSYPIVDEDRTFLGLITSDEMDFVQGKSHSMCVIRMSKTRKPVILLHLVKSFPSTL